MADWQKIIFNPFLKFLQLSGRNNFVSFETASGKAFDFKPIFVPQIE